MDRKVFVSYIKMMFKPNRLLAIYRHYVLNKKHKNKQVQIGFYSNVENSDLGEYVWIGERCNIKNASVGKHTYFGAGTSVSNASVGAFCSISFNVCIGIGVHPSNMVSTHPAFYSNKKPFVTFADRNYYQEYGSVRIGNDVLIGKNASVMYGVEIGDGAIVANNAVVTKDVPPYAIVGGVPAKVIKFRFEDSIIKKLLNYQWWNIEEGSLRESFKLYQNIDDFLKKTSSTES